MYKKLISNKNKHANNSGISFVNFNGYAAIFNNQDYQNDIIVSEAFDLEDLKSKELNLLWQHDVKEPIGVISESFVDEVGLFIKGQIITSTQKGFEASELVKQGILNSLSIGYVVLESNSDKNENGDVVRILKKLDIIEVSLVTFPANDLTMITIDD